MNRPTIAFIGTGNMARAILEGMLASGYPASNIWATRRNADQLSDLADKGVHTGSDNSAAILASDVVVLSVKPQMMRDTLATLGEALQAKKPMLISVAAGISVDALDRWSGGGLPIIRTMPNTPSLLGKGACGLFANAQVSEPQKAVATEMMEAVGLAVWVETEIDIDRVTAVSGSGPAYYFLFMEKMIEAAIALGLDRETATQLTLQTAEGAAAMAKQTGLSPAELRKRVTSPGGTTEQAILCFEHEGLGETVASAMTACADKAADLIEVLCNENINES